MWIKLKPEVLGESNSINVNFLYKKDNIYVMDNHLSAAWCWLQEIDIEKRYDFIHIDRHYDLINRPEITKENISDKNIDITKLTFEEYINLVQETEEKLNFVVKLFRWDNYIHHINNLFPNLFDKRMFITKKAGSKDDFVQYEYEIEEFINEFEYWIEDSKNGFIINLDLDYFFSRLNSKTVQLYSDETIKTVATLLKNKLRGIDVLTICLSPECCGGWENSIRVLKIFEDILELELNI